MDVLVKGNAQDKNEFSFKLIDENETGTITFEDFEAYFTKVVMNWSFLINQHIPFEEATF